MICASCHKAEAVVVVKVLVDNALSSVALCAGCAHKAYVAEGSTDALLAILAKAAPAHRVSARCPGCLTTYAEFRASGRFGCARCYDHFAPLIRSLLPRIHAGAYAHRGKAPRGAA